VNKLALLVLLWAASAFAQATFLTSIDRYDHGGFSLKEPVGANKGDHFSLEVICNRTIAGDCFVTAPYLDDGSVFALDTKRSHAGHQFYSLDSPATAEQIIHADYWWIGPQVLYEVHIRSAEPL
jgi:hypothetical protein